MSAGSNGLPAIANLSDRTKCPIAPTKRKWCDGDLAKEEAARRSQNVKLPIVAYLCSGCGCYHLTKSSGGDSVTLVDGKYSVGEFQSLAPNHPVFAQPGDPEPPLVAGDHETRVKFARRYLADCPDDWEPTTAEMCEVIGGCTKDSLRKVMAELGYRNTRGRSARWVKVPSTEETPSGFEVFPRDSAAQLLREKREREGRELHEVPDADVKRDVEVTLRDPAPSMMPFLVSSDQADKRTWIDLNTDRIRHMAVGDLLDAYAAGGLEIRVQVEVP